MLESLWWRLPAAAQDALTLAALAAPAAALGFVLFRGYRPWPLVAALLRRHLWSNAIFVALIAVSVGVGVALMAQERGLMRGTAGAAAPFDLIVAAPGNELTVLLATVYLEPADLPLLDGAAFAAVAADPRTVFAAPVAFGDSHGGAPVIGATAALVAHLGGPLAEGRPFAHPFEAVAGADAPLGPGDRFRPAHGVARAVGGSGHGAVHDQEITVVGRMRRTGSPWDRALVMPVEGVWAIHGLGDGRAPGEAPALGPPYDPARFPGAPAVVVRATSVAAAYGLRSALSTPDTMAFFPGAVLARLHVVLGDARRAMSALSLLTQGLVATAALTGLALLIRLFGRRLALLRALGAPGRFILAVVWGYAAALIAAGATIGLALGAALAAALSAVVTARTGVLVRATPGLSELHMVVAFATAAMTLALGPALLALGRPTTVDLAR